MLGSEQDCKSVADLAKVPFRAEYKVGRVWEVGGGGFCRKATSIPERLSSMVATSCGRWGLIWGAPASCTMRDMVVRARAWISATVLLVPAETCFDSQSSKLSTERQRNSLVTHSDHLAWSP